jgi:predicted dehydrogenase
MAATVVITMVDGAIATYNASWVYRGMETAWLGRWNLIGSGGSIHWEGRDGPITMIHQNGARKNIVSAAISRSSLHAVLADFAQSLRNGSPPETTGEDNIRSFQIAMAAIESADTGKPIILNPVFA